MVTPSRITVGFHNDTRTYDLYRTTAPENYDGFGTVTLTHVDDDERIVLIEVPHVEWQTIRYRSGLFRVEPEDAFDPHDVGGRLRHAMLDGLGMGQLGRQ
jgi:hypothetical protein